MILVLEWSEPNLDVDFNAITGLSRYWQVEQYNICTALALPLTVVPLLLASVVIQGLYKRFASSTSVHSRLMFLETPCRL